MALSNLALFGGAFFTPVIVGKITNDIGWQWSFYLVAIFAGVLLPFIFCFCPETTFPRPDSPTTTNYELSASTVSRRSPESSNPNSLDTKPLPPSFNPTNASPVPPKATFMQSLAPFNGRKTSESFVKLLVRPLPLLFHPAVFWAMLIQGTLIGWTVMIGVVLAALFLAPPLWFTEVQTGYMYAGPFIGALLGFALSGFLADWSTKIMIRRNKGIYEPEFRIVLVLAQLVSGCVGLYGFGFAADNVQRFGWFWPDFFFATEVIGMVLGAVASALYIVDAHRESSLSAMTRSHTARLILALQERLLSKLSPVFWCLRTSSVSV